MPSPEHLPTPRVSPSACSDPPYPGNEVGRGGLTKRAKSWLRWITAFGCHAIAGRSGADALPVGSSRTDDRQVVDLIHAYLRGLAHEYVNVNLPICPSYAIAGP